MNDANIGRLLLDAAAQWPDRAALCDVGDGSGEPTRWSWQQLAERASWVARAVGDAGYGRGDCVGLIGHNDAAYVARWFGVALAGCTLAPLPVMSAPEEVAWRAGHAGMKLIIAGEATAALMDQAQPRFEAHQAAPTIWFDIPRDPGASLRPPAINGRPRTSPEDPALLLYTSGTTGRSKGALIGHGALVRHTTNVTREAIPLTPDDVVFAALPFSHSFGCRMVMLACARTGARMVILRRFRAALAWRTLAAERVTWLPVVPTMLAGLVRARNRPTLPHLRWSLSAGATLAEPIRRAASEVLGAPVYQGYGMTEATFSAMDHPPAAPTPGCVGRPSRGVDIRVVSAQGDDVCLGERGEVWLRGDNTFLRYLNDPDATAAVFQDGWVRSGDVGLFDKAGRLAIVDRLKDLIVRGGFNVYPSEVEAALVAHATVHQVAVVGIPDAYHGEEVVAVVVTNEGLLQVDALDAWARERLASYKIPRRYAQVSEMPLGPSRKILKRVLRQRLLEGGLVSTPLPTDASARG